MDALRKQQGLKNYYYKKHKTNKYKMKKSILVTIAFSLIVSIGFAQKTDKLSKEEREAARVHYEEKVYPVKKQAHDEFLAGLSAEDKAFLVTKRGEKQALQKETREIQKELQGLKEEGKSKEEVKAAHKTAMEPIKAKQKEFSASMKPFMERNKALIEKSIAPIKDNQEMWKEEQANAKKSPKREDSERAVKKEGKRALNFVLWNGEMKNGKGKGAGQKQGRNGGKSKRR